MVCKLNKVVYGLEQVPRSSYARLDKYLEIFGFKKCTVDSSLYLRQNHNVLLIIMIFFDDVIYRGNDYVSEVFLDEMNKEFELRIIGE